MFKKKVVESAVIEVTAEDIHQEFDNAQDELLREAEEILDNTVIEDKNEYNELVKLGFTSVGKVKETKQKIEDVEKLDKLAKKIKYYKEKYPGQKFITEEKLNFICKKYGLVIGIPRDFIGNIPPKNRKEMIDFKLNDSNYKYTKTYIDFIGNKETEITEEEYEKQMKRIDKTPLLGLHEYCSKKSNLSVVATPDLFNLEDKIISNYRIKDKDPIILYPVSGGYLIISKWGNEANIEDIK